MPGRKRKRTRRRKVSFVLDKGCDEQTRLQYYDTLKDRFVCHALPPELTKALVYAFVFFVWAHEQAIRTKLRLSNLYCTDFPLHYLGSVVSVKPYNNSMPQAIDSKIHVKEQKEEIL